MLLKGPRWVPRLNSWPHPQSLLAFGRIHRGGALGLEGSSHWLPPQLQGLKLRLTPLGDPLNPPQDSQGCCQGARSLKAKLPPSPASPEGASFQPCLELSGGTQRTWGEGWGEMTLGHRVGVLPNASRGSREAGGEAEAPGHTSVVLGSESKIPEGLWRNGVGAGDTFQTGLH